jgi:hypothetical protein
MKSLYKKGISLTEMIIYISLLTIILVVIINSLVSIVKSYRVIKSARDIETSAVLALDRMEREIRNAVNVDAGNSVFNTNLGSLGLNTVDDSGNAATVKFYLDNGALVISENGVYSGPLTVSGVNISTLIFRRITTPNSTGVKIEMTLQAANGAATTTANFYDTALLRGSY